MLNIIGVTIMLVGLTLIVTHVGWTVAAGVFLCIVANNFEQKATQKWLDRIGKK